MKKLLLSTAVLALTAACQPATSTDTAATETPAASTPAAATASAAIGDWGFDIPGMDTSYVAGDDFYRYANGTWLDTTEIPSDRSNYGMFTVLAIEAEEQVQAIILELAAMDAAADEAKTTIEDVERTARRVFGGANPLVVGFERTLRNARAVLVAREAGFDSVREALEAMTAGDSYDDDADL